MALPELMKANENYGTFVVMNVSTVDDGYGGYTQEYTPGATFEGVLILSDSIQTQVAQKQGVTGIYTLTFEKPMRLPWHTVFTREGTTETYRVVSRDESSTPATTNLNLRQVKVEEFTAYGEA